MPSWAGGGSSGRQLGRLRTHTMGHLSCLMSYQVLSGNERQVQGSPLPTMQMPTRWTRPGKSPPQRMAGPHLRPWRLHDSFFWGSHCTG